jgi:hypothetical protein
MLQSISEGRERHALLAAVKSKNAEIVRRLYETEEMILSQPEVYKQSNFIRIDDRKLLFDRVASQSAGGASTGVIRTHP